MLGLCADAPRYSRYAATATAIDATSDTPTAPDMYLSSGDNANTPAHATSTATTCASTYTTSAGVLGRVAAHDRMNITAAMDKMTLHTSTNPRDHATEKYDRTVAAHASTRRVGTVSNRNAGIPKNADSDDGTTTLRYTASSVTSPAAATATITQCQNVKHSPRAAQSPVTYASLGGLANVMRCVHTHGANSKNATGSSSGDVTRRPAPRPSHAAVDVDTPSQPDDSDDADADVGRTLPSWPLRDMPDCKCCRSFTVNTATMPVTPTAAMAMSHHADGRSTKSCMADGNGPSGCVTGATRNNKSTTTHTMMARLPTDDADPDMASADGVRGATATLARVHRLLAPRDRAAWPPRYTTAHPTATDSRLATHLAVLWDVPGPFHGCSCFSHTPPLRVAVEPWLLLVLAELDVPLPAQDTDPTDGVGVAVGVGVGVGVLMPVGVGVGVLDTECTFVLDTLAAGDGAGVVLTDDALGVAVGLADASDADGDADGVADGVRVDDLDDP